MGMGMGNYNCLLEREGPGHSCYPGPPQLGTGSPWPPKGALCSQGSPPCLPRPCHGLGTAAVSPAVVKIPATLTRESSGLYTVSSTLFAHVTREDRYSLYHCTVHYWLRGQRRAVDSRQVNVTVFCESGAGGRACCLVLRGGAPHRHSLLPQTLRST